MGAVTLRFKKTYAVTPVHMSLCDRKLTLRTVCQGKNVVNNVKFLAWTNRIVLLYCSFTVFTVLLKKRVTYILDGLSVSKLPVKHFLGWTIPLSWQLNVSEHGRWFLAVPSSSLVGRPTTMFQKPTWPSEAGSRWIYDPRWFTSLWTVYTSYHVLQKVELQS